MTKPSPDKSIREVDRRTNDGIDVRLLWNSVTGQVAVAVHDMRANDTFEFQVAAPDALIAFQHPYAYASHHRTGICSPSERHRGPMEHDPPRRRPRARPNPSGQPGA